MPVHYSYTVFTCVMYSKNIWKASKKKVLWVWDINLYLLFQNVCSTLWCTVGTTCHSKLDGAVDGTSCGEDKVSFSSHDRDRKMIVMRLLILVLTTISFLYLGRRVLYLGSLFCLQYWFVSLFDWEYGSQHMETGQSDWWSILRKSTPIPANSCLNFYSSKKGV